MWCPYITKKINYKKIIVVTNFFGGLNVLMPLVPKMELGFYLNIIDISLEVDAPIGLGTMFTNTNDWGKYT
jgi:hypothetical protein